MLVPIFCCALWAASQDLHSYLATVLEHPFFAEWEKWSPKAMDEGARVAPFTSAGFQARYNAVRERFASTPPQGTPISVEPFYTCGLPMSWINLLWTSTPSVRVNSASIERIAAHHFPDNLPPASGNLPMDLHVVIPPGEEGYDVESQRGGLRLLTPMETVAGVVKACAMCLRDNCSDDTARRWQATLRGATVHFVASPEDMHALAAFQLREDPLIDAEFITFTACQRIQLVVAEGQRLVDRLGSCTPQKLAKHFLDNVRFAQSSEKFTISFVDAVRRRAGGMVRLIL